LSPFVNGLKFSVNAGVIIGTVKVPPCLGLAEIEMGNKINKNNILKNFLSTDI
jgi:hypothetical protein